VFQQWSLFYFLKNKENFVNAETLADNMCLTAVIGFDTDKVEPELHRLVILGHIEEGTDEQGYKVYHSTLKGRMFVKQNFLAPLIRIKAADRIKAIIEYMDAKNGNQTLVSELHSALVQKDQNSFLVAICNIALNKFTPFMEMLDEISRDINSGIFTLHS